MLCNRARFLIVSPEAMLKNQANFFAYSLAINQ